MHGIMAKLLLTLADNQYFFNGIDLNFQSVATPSYRSILNQLTSNVIAAHTCTNPSTIQAII
jgi:hypothetical protein